MATALPRLGLSHSWDLTGLLPKACCALRLLWQQALAEAGSCPSKGHDKYLLAPATRTAREMCKCVLCCGCCHFGLWFWHCFRLNANLEGKFSSVQHNFAGQGLELQMKSGSVCAACAARAVDVFAHIESVRRDSQYTSSFDSWAGAQDILIVMSSVV